MRARILKGLAGALLLLAVAGVARADVAVAGKHTTGLILMKSCPAAPVAAGSTFQCSFVLTNLDPDHGVRDLLVTKQHILPNFAPKGAAAPLSCLQNGVAVKTLGKFGSATDTCSNSAIRETAPACSAKGTKLLWDEISASGVDAAFPSLPVSQTASDSVTVQACSQASTHATAKSGTPRNRATSSLLRSCGFLLVDVDSMDVLSAPDANETDAAGLRASLPIFSAVGATIDLRSGTVGDEGWFSPRVIPQSWANAGPTGGGLRSLLMDPRGAIRDLVPLRAEDLEMLKGSCVCAAVYDGDIGTGNRKGENVGIAAFAVLEVNSLSGQSPDALPGVTIRVLDAEQVCAAPLRSFTDVQ